MKKFENATIEEISIQSTAFGPYDPDFEDSEKYQVEESFIDPVNNTGTGWQQTFGRSQGEN